MSSLTEQERLLSRVVAGDLSERDPEWRNAVAEKPELGTHLAELKRAAADLERVSREDRELRDEARREVLPGDRGLVEEALRRSTSRGRGRRTFLWVAAAAIVVTATAVIGPRAFRDDADATRPDGYLTGTELQLLAPAGPGSSLDVFRWSRELPEGHFFEVVVECLDADAELDPTGEAMITSERLLTPEWRPSEEQRARMGGTIRWTVETRRRSGQPLDASPPWAEASVD